MSKSMISVMVEFLKVLHFEASLTSPLMILWLPALQASMTRSMKCLASTQSEHHDPVVISCIYLQLLWGYLLQIQRVVTVCGLTRMQQKRQPWDQGRYWHLKAASVGTVPCTNKSVLAILTQEFSSQSYTRWNLWALPCASNKLITMVTSWGQRLSVMPQVARSYTNEHSIEIVVNHDSMQAFIKQKVQSALCNVD